MGLQTLQRGYFMNQQEKDAVLGRVVREHRNAANELAFLVAEAHRLAKLSGRIERIFSQTEAHQIITEGKNLIREIEEEDPKATLISRDKILGLYRSLSEFTQEHERLLRELKNLET